MDLNRWSGIGRLVGDPQMVGDSDSPKRIVSFAISNVRGKRGKDRTNYFNCVAFTALADLIFKNCRKGDRIGIDGELRHKKYVDKKTSAFIYSLDIVVYSIQFLSRKHSRKESQEDFESITNLESIF